MNIQQLKVFCAVADTRSFSLAAAALFLSQPAVSQQVRRLEQTLGLQLFARGQGDVALTAAGAQLYPLARQVLDGVCHLEATAKDLSVRQTEQAVIVIDLATTPGAALLSPALARFHAAYPGVRVVMQKSTVAEVKRNVLLGRADFGLTLVSGTDDRQHYRYDSLWPEELIVCAAPTHPLLRHGAAVTLPAIMAYPFIFPSATSATLSVFQAAVHRSAGGHYSNLQVAMELNNPQAMKGALVQSHCLAAMLSRSVAGELARGSLRPVPVEGLDLSCAFALFHRAGRPLSRPLRNLLRYVRAGPDYPFRDRNRSGAREPTNLSSHALDNKR